MSLLLEKCAALGAGSRRREAAPFKSYRPDQLALRTPTSPPFLVHRASVIRSWNMLSSELIDGALVRMEQCLQLGLASEAVVAVSVLAEAAVRRALDDEDPPALVCMRIPQEMHR